MGAVKPQEAEGGEYPPSKNGVSFLEGCLELDRCDITKHWRCVKCHQMLQCIVGKFDVNFTSTSFLTKI